jgi:hypothetical protein
MRGCLKKDEKKHKKYMGRSQPTDELSLILLSKDRVSTASETAAHERSDEMDVDIGPIFEVQSEIP